MSLAIDPGKVKSVLIDGYWYLVKGKTFFIDAYEFVGPDTDGIDGHRDGFVYHGGGNSGICATGFCFKSDESGKWIYGPLSSISAVKC